MLESLNVGLAFYGFKARLFEIVEVLEDDVIRVDKLGNLLTGPAVCDQVWIT